MHKKIPMKALIAAAALFLFGLNLEAQQTDAQISSARTAAIGGRHAALADDLTTLFSNHAGFRSAGPELYLAELTLGLTGPIFDITSTVIEGMGGDPMELIASDNVQSLFQNLYAALNLVGPLSFGYAGKGLGFVFYSHSDLSFSNRGTVPTITTCIGERLVFAGGYAFRIPLPADWESSLDAGALLKTSIGAQSTIDADLLSLLTAFDDPTGLLSGAPMDLSLGIGLDLDLLFSFRKWLSVGLVGRDFYAPTLVYTYASLEDFLASADAESSSTELEPIDLSMGFLFRPPLGFLKRYISDLKVMLDYEDILDFLTHPASSSNHVLHVGLGVELVLIEILSIRGELYQGLFTT